jgi:hypothetical protein
MPLSRSTKIVLWSVVTSVALVVSVFAYGVYCAWDKFASEERICGAFQPVIGAIDHFAEAKGALPTNLVQLVPAYVAELPTSPVADSIDYRIMPGGTNWQLTVHSRVTGPRRIFIQRSSHQFTEEERRQSVSAFHGWVVFKDEL